MADPRLRVWCGAVVVICSCSPAPTSTVVPPPASVTRRHWDQACRVSGPLVPIVLAGELFDTTGLTGALTEMVPRRNRSGARAPFYDFITWYGIDGGIQALGTWDASIDSATSVRAEAVLRRRARRIGGLLAPAAFRTRVTFAPRVRIEVVRPVTCYPHMVHKGRARPTGLPPDVTTWGGSRYIPPGDTLTTVVRIRVAPDGSVMGVDPLSGPEKLVSRARSVIQQLRFEPGLRNGIRVQGTLVQAFHFRNPVEKDGSRRR